MDYGLAVIGGISQVVWILETYVKDTLYDKNVQLLRNANAEEWTNKYFNGLIFGSCAARLNSTTGILIGGGLSNSNGFFPTRKTWYFNLNSDEWIEGPLLMQARIASACGVMKTDLGSIKVVVAGGQVSKDNVVQTEINLDHNVTNSVEILDMSSNDIHWDIGPSLPTALHSADIVERADGVYLIGGISKNMTYETIFHLSNMFQSVLMKWNVLKKRLIIGRAMHKAILVPDHLVKCRSISN